ncbi:DUF362 domain-containing protein [Pelorhabdus rhamnosifermentans]|uniref:DUF362 domain-containing protein n=1 Tax=Pelorhabdus rhamnosifermentans TaxID=2772457 RepID=UPI0028B20E86|nr:4Fe-4S binding protein [Pelorhabdus rhamnosifermentans]
MRMILITTGTMDNRDIIISHSIQKIAIRIAISDISWLILLRNSDMGYQISAMCKQCGKCQSVCPVGAIVINNGQYEIIPERCKSCGACASACPVSAIKRSGINAFNNLIEKIFGKKHLHRAGHTQQHSRIHIDTVKCNPTYVLPLKLVSFNADRSACTYKSLF